MSLQFFNITIQNLVIDFEIHGDFVNVSDMGKTDVISVLRQMSLCFKVKLICLLKTPFALVSHGKYARLKVILEEKILLFA